MNYDLFQLENCFMENQLSTLLVIKMDFFSLHNFMGYFLLWEICTMSRVFTTTMLSRSVSS